MNGAQKCFLFFYLYPSLTCVDVGDPSLAPGDKETAYKNQKYQKYRQT